MKLRVLTLWFLSLTVALAAFADTLHLKNGQTVYGTFNGRTPQGIQFTGTDGRTLIYPYQEVENLTSVRSPPRRGQRRLSRSLPLRAPSFSFE